MGRERGEGEVSGGSVDVYLCAGICGCVCGYVYRHKDRYRYISLRRTIVDCAAGVVRFVVDI